MLRGILFIAVCSGICISAQAFSQTIPSLGMTSPNDFLDSGMLSGRVTDDNRMTPAHTFIQLNDDKRIELSPNGKFEFLGLMPGLHRIQIDVAYRDMSTGQFVKKFIIISNIIVKPGENRDLRILDYRQIDSMSMDHPLSLEEAQLYAEWRLYFLENRSSIIAELGFDAPGVIEYKNIFSSEKSTMYPVLGETVFRAVVPGLAQLYNHRRVRGVIFLSASVLTWSGFFCFRARGNVFQQEYEETTDFHDLVNSITYNKAKINLQVSNILLLTGYGLWALSVGDAVIDSIRLRRKYFDQSLEIGFNSGFSSMEYRRSF